jgi:hypothetical protein
MSARHLILRFISVIAGKRREEIAPRGAPISHG